MISVISIKCLHDVYLHELEFGGTGGMAKNTGRGHRIGAVRRRSPTYNPRTKTYVKRGPDGRFIDAKADGTRFKGVRRER
jgi:hypothetical protein